MGHIDLYAAKTWIINDRDRLAFLEGKSGAELNLNDFTTTVSPLIYQFEFKSDPPSIIYNPLKC
jgi:hypothetical protein